MEAIFFFKGCSDFSFWSWSLKLKGPLLPIKVTGWQGITSVPNSIVGSVHSCFFLTVSLWFFCWKVNNYYFSLFPICSFPYVFLQLTKNLSLLMESQNNWGWKGHLEVIWSNSPAQSGSPGDSILIARAGAYTCIAWRSCALLRGSYIKLLNLLQVCRNQLCLLERQLLLGLHHLVHINSARPISKMGPTHQGNSHTGDFQELINEM